MGRASKPVVSNHDKIKNRFMELFETAEELRIFFNLILPPNSLLKKILEIEKIQEKEILCDTVLSYLGDNFFVHVGTVRSDDEIIRELIIIELFPKDGTLPKNMAEVKNRMLQLQFEPKSDDQLDDIKDNNDNIDMMNEIDKVLPLDSKIRQMKSFKDKINQRKIHKFTIIQHTEPEKVGAFVDYTKTTINQRIEEGYRDGLKHLDEI